MARVPGAVKGYLKGSLIGDDVNIPAACATQGHGCEVERGAFGPYCDFGWRIGTHSNPRIGRPVRTGIASSRFGPWLKGERCSISEQEVECTVTIGSIYSSTTWRRK